jgi:hypothetical protein
METSLECIEFPKIHVYSLYGRFVDENLEWNVLEIILTALQFFVNFVAVEMLSVGILISMCIKESKTKLNSVALVRERTMPTERRPFVGEVVPTFADRGCCVVRATDPPGR